MRYGVVEETLRFTVKKFCISINNIFKRRAIMSEKTIYLFWCSKVAIHSECSGFAPSITELVGLNTDSDLGSGL